MSQALLHIEDLSLTFPIEGGPRRVLDRVTLDLYPNEVLGLVGESGSGKTITSQALPQITLTYGSGCRCADRCPDVRPVCREHRPQPFAVTSGHTVICHKYPEDAP